jgi:hypothetical protein
VNVEKLTIFRNGFEDSPEYRPFGAPKPDVGAFAKCDHRKLVRRLVEARLVGELPGLGSESIPPPLVKAPGAGQDESCVKVSVFSGKVLRAFGIVVGSQEYLGVRKQGRVQKPRRNNAAKGYV